MTRALNSVPELPPGRHVDFDVDQAIQAMPDTYIQCRDWQHSWRPFRTEYIAKERVYEVELKCSRCKTIRHRLLSETGAVLRNNYGYAKGYLITGMGRLTGGERDGLRLESVQRSINSGKSARRRTS